MLPEIIFFAAAGIVFLLAVINVVKKQRSFERESFYWVICAIGMVILAINPNIIIKISHIVNVRYPPSLLFLIAILFILYLLFKLTCQISNLREQNKELAQESIILKKRFKELQDEIEELKLQK
ncbi:DUF2304 domain-containing protein [Clostridioides difficile]